MDSLANNRHVVQLFLAALAAGDLKTLGELVVDDYEHNIPGLPPGRQALLAFAAGLQRSFTGLSMPITSLVAENDLVAAHVRATGTHIEDFGPFKAHGRRIDLAVAHLYRLSGNRLASHTEVADWAEFARQAA